MTEMGPSGRCSLVFDKQSTLIAGSSTAVLGFEKSVGSGHRCSLVRNKHSTPIQ